jgi:hypothetical protein
MPLSGLNYIVWPHHSATPIDADGCGHRRTAGGYWHF